MGNLLRLAVFILALGSLAAGTGWMLLKERERVRTLERLVRLSTPPHAAPPTPADTAANETLLATLRDSHVRTQRITLFFGGLALACVIAVAVFPARPPRPALEPDTRAARHEMRGLETLARANLAQREELDHEREARHRSEQDLHLQQVLANRALQDKIRLGQDLHDGLVQTLYATGLMLETAEQRLAATPPETEAVSLLLARAKNTLNAAIREARGTISGLTPYALEEQNLTAAIHAIIDHLDGGRLHSREVTLAPDLPVFSAEIRTEILQIIRESLSNALRHGAASRIEIALTPLPDQRWQLSVKDNGHGFDPAAVVRGHGLNNLAARAAKLGALLTLESTPGSPTTILVTLPASTVPAASGHPA